MKNNYLLYLIAILIAGFFLSTVAYAMSHQQKTERPFTGVSFQANNARDVKAGVNQEILVSSLPADFLQENQAIGLYLIDDTARRSEKSSKGQEDTESYLSSLVSSLALDRMPNESSALLILGVGLVFFAGIAKRRMASH